jgi:histidinol dehydrogenase
LVSTAELEPGITVGEKITPISSAGLWVPCRKAPLASTMLMLVVPAMVAGVKGIIAATPPLRGGSVDGPTLVAAEISGATKVIRGNGVALTAALAFGTESVPRAEAIYGPGPPAIAAAQGYVGIYGVRTGPPMGPSECMIVAGDASDPGEAAADLLNECEHGPDSSAVLVTDSPDLAKKVSAALASAVDELGEPRKGYVLTALEQNGMIVVTGSLEEAAAMVNSYAPEHLQIALDGEKGNRVLGMIENAGEILLGQSTPFSAANYALGITAVLPTGGSAKGFSGITAKDFLKTSSIGRVERDALPGVCDVVSALGEVEGFPAHVEACRRKIRKQG